MKKIWMTLFTLLLLSALPLLLLYGARAGEGVRQGLQLAYRAVLPALFPAAVVCGILSEMMEYIPLPPTFTLWFTSHLCGFPLGIKTTVRAYQRGIISREQCIKLTVCCANASPSFLITYAGGAVFGNLRAGALLFAGQLFISFVLAIAGGALKGSTAPPLPRPSLIKVLTEGISSAAIGCLGLTGYIALFGALAALCAPIPGFRLWYGFLEISGGLSVLEPSIPHFFIGAAMVGFSGLSILLQNATYLIHADLPLLPMLAGKVLYAILLPPTVYGLIQSFPLTLAIFGFFSLFLISFVKRRKRQYNVRDRLARSRAERSVL